MELNEILLDALWAVLRKLLKTFPGGLVIARPFHLNEDFLLAEGGPLHLVVHHGLNLEIVFLLSPLGFFLRRKGLRGARIA